MAKGSPTTTLMKAMKVIRVMKKGTGLTTGKGKGNLSMKVSKGNGSRNMKKPAAIKKKTGPMKAMKAMKRKNQDIDIYISDVMLEAEKKRRLWNEWYDMKMHNKSFGEGCEPWSLYYKYNKDRPTEDVDECWD